MPKILQRMSGLIKVFVALKFTVFESQHLLQYYNERAENVPTSDLIEPVFKWMEVNLYLVWRLRHTQDSVNNDVTIPHKNTALS